MLKLGPLLALHMYHMWANNTVKLNWIRACNEKFFVQHQQQPKENEACKWEKKNVAIYENVDIALFG